MSANKESLKVFTTSDGSFVVKLSDGHSVPYLPDHVGSDASGVGIDITDPDQYEVCDGLALCWNVLNQCHEFHNPLNLKLFEGNANDGYIPFDHATSRLKAVLSLLKFAQDKCYGKKFLETTLPRSK